MSISFIDFVQYLLHNPILMIITVLMLGVILVNGWTDAPNTIATCISTRSIKPKRALFMAIIFNFLGVLIMTSLNATVANTIFHMVNFGTDTNAALIALCATLATIILWALTAWKFGIPTSESHALIAGLSGASIALHNSFEGINGDEWIKVLYGLIFCVLLGFIGGWLFVKLTERLCKRMDHRRAQRIFKGSSICGGAMMAFMHGAQDGQKFMGVFLLGIFMANGSTSISNMQIPFWLIIICSLTMGIGTSIGGYKIIKSVGIDMVKLEKYQGFGADASASLCLLIFSLFGIPVSTSHAKLTSVMGAGAARRMTSVNWNFVKKMVIVWLLTFPGAGCIAFVITKVCIMLI